MLSIRYLRGKFENMGRHKNNIKIAGFSKRIDWIIENLDTDQTLLRFCTCHKDLIEGLGNAIKNGDFSGERIYGGGVPSDKVLTVGISGKAIPPILIKWLLRLYRDLSREWLLTPSIEDFFERGRSTYNARQRWQVAIQLYAKERRRLEDTARNFYQDLDYSRAPECPLKGLRLLTRPGWLRSTPMELNENTELQYLNAPSRGRSFQHRKLEGLNGDYIFYKGSSTYRNRRKSIPEPQHNGEIFCATSILFDAGEFVGFRYDLARYFDYVNSCEILGAELADWTLSQESRKPALTSLLMRGEPQSAFELKDRACYPGLNCLTVFLNYEEDGKRKLGNYFLLHKRDETQLQAQNTVHVLPAGGHQGFSKGAQSEDTAFWRTIVREFLEELFDIERLYKQPENWEDFLEYPEVKKLVEAFFKDEYSAARIYLHGFGLDPITLKPEVIVTIVVDWKIAIKKLKNAKLEYNWEVRSKNKSRHQWVNLSKDQLLLQAEGHRQSIGDSDTFLDTLPAGAACMIATAKHYAKLGLPK